MTRTRRFAPPLALCVLALSFTTLASVDNRVADAAPDAAATQNLQAPFDSFRLLVKIESGAAVDTAEQRLRDAGAMRVRRFYQPRNFQADSLQRLNRWRIVQFDHGGDVNLVLNRLRQSTQFEKVLPDIMVRIAAAPNDLDERLWGLHNAGQTGGSAGADIDAVTAWDTITDATATTVAVIDTGVDYTHPDLAANMWRNPGEIPDNGIDDDNNGFVDDVHGWDFANNDNLPMDDNGHGTHVAGTIAAVGNNGQGIVGVAWNARIMALKFLSQDGNGFTSDAIDSLLYAVDNGAKVSNNSWGSFGQTHVLEAFDAPLREAIVGAAEAGHLFVAAAGNEGNLTDGRYSAYPAGMTVNNILAVVATDHDDALADFSNFGVVETDLAAPGVNIFSTQPNGAYDTMDGTSMATPHVAGVAALLWSLRPDLTQYEVKALLMNHGDKIASLNDKTGSGARLNVAQAVAALSGAGQCDSFTATPQQHINAGRAHACGYYNFYACANGSNEQIGSKWSSTQVALFQTAPNYFTRDACSSGVDLPPTIFLDGQVEQRILVGTSYTAPGATATDREDGDISGDIQISGSVDTGTPGDYVIRYDVADSAGNPAVTERRLIRVVERDNPPNLHLFGPACRIPAYCIAMLVKQNDPWQEPGYVAVDEIDGDLTDQVVSSGVVRNDTSTIGRYRVNYDVVDSGGNHFPYRDDVFRDVFVLHANRPYIHVEPDDVEFFHPRGECCLANRVDPFAMDLKDGLNAVETEGEFDENVAGTYVLRHHFTDSDGYTAERYQTIHVVDDTTPPSITLNGDADVYLDVGASWTDPGATATDEVDPNPVVNRSGEVDTNTEGVYELSYTATDASGNVSDPVIRTVTVGGTNQCETYTATPDGHISAGRAHSCGTWGLNACANGSNDNLGFRWSSTQANLHENPVGSGTFHAGACP